MKDPLHFAHGNGFPSACYQQLLQVLEIRYDCSYIDKSGHNPLFPVTDNWGYLVDELIASIRETGRKPVIGLGHSLGGVLTLLAAIKEPSLFKAIVMIDSPLPGPFKSALVKIAKYLGVIDRITPARGAKRRKQQWQSRDELIMYLRSKPLFQTFSEACLNDYIQFGFKQTDGSYQLLFDRQVEYSIFRTLPHHLSEYQQQLTVPAVLLYGEQSLVVDRFDVRNMQKKHGVDCYSIPGTHMLPMENPDALGAKIFQIIDNLTTK